MSSPAPAKVLVIDDDKDLRYSLRRALAGLGHTVIEADIFESGWFSDGAAWPHVLAWIALELLVVWAAWRVAKRLRNRLIGAAVGFVPFFVVLYFVFQNVNRLLPPNL